MRLLILVLQRWHRLLGLSRKPTQSWHQDRLQEELQELRDAKTPLERLSETSDVFFTISRATYDGFPIQELPPFFTFGNIPVYAYMFGKFTSRWAFYRAAAYLCGSPHYHTVREVVNPSKDSKLDQVATRHNIDPLKFKRIACRLRRFWPLFP